MDSARVGARIRAGRQAKKLTLRQLAMRVGVSASMLSLVENGRTLASVTTLRSLVGELDISLDELFGESVSPVPTASSGPFAGSSGPVHRPGQRQLLTLEGGVTWERLSTLLGQFVESRLVTYPPHSSSSNDGQLSQHNGTEFAYIFQGTLTLQLRFETYTVTAGDSLSFDSTEPHLYANDTDQPAQGVWFEVGRRTAAASDREWPVGISCQDMSTHRS